MSSPPEMNNRKRPLWPPEDPASPMVWLSRRPSALVDFGCLLGCAVMMISAMATVAGIVLLVRALYRALAGSH
jgi:hypothetical protein